MNRALLIPIALFFVASPQSFSKDCPTAHPKYLELITRLDTFTQSVKKAPECLSLSQELQDLKALYAKSDRDLIDRASAMKDGKLELTPEEVTQVQTYAEKVTSKMGVIVSSLETQPNCLPRKKTSALTAIAGITGEVASLSASFAGPYGVAIRTAGAAVSGILSGIDAVMKKSRDSYDFDASEDRLLFMSQLCTYDSIQNEIITLSEPERQVTILERLKKELSVKRSKLKASHPVSAAVYDSVYELKKTYAPAVKAFEVSLKNVEGESAPEHALDRCLHIAEMTYLTEEMDALVSITKENELSPYFDAQGDYCPAALSQTAKGPNGIPTAKECLSSQDPEELRRRNDRSLGILRAILRSYEAGFQAASKSLTKSAESEKGKLKSEYNPVEWLIGTHTKQEWTEKELEVYKVLVAPSSYSARRELTARKEYLDERFFRQLAPRFVDWYLSDLEENLENFSKHSKQAVRMLAKQLNGNSAETKDWPSLLAEVSAKDSRTMHSLVYASIQSLVDEMRKARFSLGTVNAYCTYFTNHGSLSATSSKYCSKSGKNGADQEISEFAALLDGFTTFAEGCYKKQYVDRESRDALLAHIVACHENVGILKAL